MILAPKPELPELDSRQISFHTPNERHDTVENSKRSTSLMLQSMANSTKSPERSFLSPKRQNFLFDQELNSSKMQKTQIASKNDLWLDLESPPTPIANLKSIRVPTDNEAVMQEIQISPTASNQNIDFNFSPKKQSADDEPQSPLRVVVRRNQRNRSSARELIGSKAALFNEESSMRREFTFTEKREGSWHDKTISTQVNSQFTLKITKVMPLNSNNVFDNKQNLPSDTDEGSGKVKRSKTQNPEPRDVKKTWSKLVHVFKSTMLMKREEVKSIMDVVNKFTNFVPKFKGDIHNEIDTFQLRKIAPVPYGKRDLTKEDFAKDAFDRTRKVRFFCECAAIGGPKHVEAMKQLILEDPRRFLLEPDDPDHLINKPNAEGHRPLYIAAKNGNFEVIKLLLEHKANHFLLSQVAKGVDKKDTPLEAAVKWNHSKIVEEFLERRLYDKKFIESCKKYTTNNHIKNLLDKYSFGNKKSGICFLTCWKK